MIRGKNAEGEWKTILGAIILVILIFVGYLFVSKIILGGKSMTDITNCAKNKDWKCLFGKDAASSSPSSNTEAGNVYICDSKYHSLIVGEKTIYIKMEPEKCATGAAIIGLYSTNSGTALLETITVAEGDKVCSSKAGVCIKLLSVDKSGTKPSISLSYTPLSESFQEFTLTQGEQKDFWCGKKQFRIMLDKYVTWSILWPQNHALFSLNTLDKNGNSGYFSPDEYGCIDLASGIDSGFDRDNSGAFKCIDGGTVVCGSLKITCAEFNKNKKQITIARCYS